MKTFFTLLLILFGNPCFAVGWEEVSRETAENFNIDVTIEIDAHKNCHVIYVHLPLEIIFRELGIMEFRGAQYQKITTKEKGWQLMPKGTQINLPTTSIGNSNKTITLCLSSEDLKYGYISADYSGGLGASPMVVLIDISDFM